MIMADSNKAAVGEKLVEMRDICISFGGVHAVDHVSVDLHAGEVVGLLGHNGAGKSTLIKILSGAYQADSGDILIRGEKATITNPRDARRYKIETIYQTLALADNLDAASNLFLGRELVTSFGLVDDDAMEAETRKIMSKLNPNFKKFHAPVKALSGGQRQCVAISRAAGWGSKLIIMDEPTAALGIQETTRVEHIIRGLKERGVPVIIISHNLRQVFNLVDRIVVFRQGRIAGVLDAKTASGNDVVAMITGVDQGVHEDASYI